MDIPAGGSTDPVADPLTLLREGSIDVEGRLVDASNATLFGTIALDGVSASCVYKPIAGERPLWDFPDGTLAHREVATFLVSEATGWHVVPPTVLRDGPFGEGMCQLWIDIDPSATLIDVVPQGCLPQGWLSVLDALGSGGRPVTLTHADDPRLRRMALLDVVVNNADRKGGHILPTVDGRLYGCDHGVCFNVDEKLRTVLWGWAGAPLSEEEVDVLLRLRSDLEGDGPLATALRPLLAGEELVRTRTRVRRLLSRSAHPRPGQGWPSIPWPPF